MAFIGFAYTNPLAGMAMLDSNRWRTVVYADTPRCKKRYQDFLNGNRGNRKAVLFMIGAHNLSVLSKDLNEFYSVLVFDELQNLHRVNEAIDTFEVVDIENKEHVFFPKSLTPAELQDAVSAEGSPKANLLVSKLQKTLGKRKPSVLESTSKMPDPEPVPDSGAKNLMSMIKAVLDEKEDALEFQVVLDNYSKFLFRMVPRSALTSQVTKKLPKEARDFWQVAIDLANSDIGLRMASAFKALCEAKGSDYRVGQAVRDYGLSSYSGDFVYFTSVLSPNRSFEFLPEFVPLDCDGLENKTTFVPSPTTKKAKKKRKKKAD